MSWELVSIVLYVLGAMLCWMTILTNDEDDNRLSVARKGFWWAIVWPALVIGAVFYVAAKTMMKRDQ